MHHLEEQGVLSTSADSRGVAYLVFGTYSTRQASGRGMPRGPGILPLTKHLRRCTVHNLPCVLATLNTQYNTQVLHSCAALTSLGFQASSMTRRSFDGQPSSGGGSKIREARLPFDPTRPHSTPPPEEPPNHQISHQSGSPPGIETGLHPCRDHLLFKRAQGGHVLVLLSEASDSQSHGGFGMIHRAPHQ